MPPRPPIFSEPLRRICLKPKGLPTFSPNTKDPLKKNLLQTPKFSHNPKYPPHKNLSLIPTHPAPPPPPAHPSWKLNNLQLILPVFCNSKLLQLLLNLLLMQLKCTGKYIRNKFFFFPFLQRNRRSFSPLKQTIVSQSFECSVE